MDKLKIKKLSSLVSNQGVSDTTAPTVTGFAATTPNIGGTIAITEFTASEAGVSFLITESSTPPASGAAGWSETAPTEHVASDGSCTLYPWVKDPSGNVSAVYGSPVAVEVYETPAYTNAGGTGDRMASIAITTTATIALGTMPLLINGSQSSALSWSTQSVDGKVIKFDFGAKRLITEIKWYMNKTANHGTWQLQGSANDTDWVNIGSQFTLGGSVAGTALNAMSANTQGYRYYRLLGVTGNMDTTLYEREIEFKLGNILP